MRRPLRTGESTFPLPALLSKGRRSGHAAYSLSCQIQLTHAGAVSHGLVGGSAFGLIDAAEKAPQGPIAHSASEIEPDAMSPVQGAELGNGRCGGGAQLSRGSD